jgi:hypothetical protein
MYAISYTSVLQKNFQYSKCIILKDIVASLNDVLLAWIVRLPAEFAVFFIPSWWRIFNDIRFLKRENLFPTLRLMGLV